MAGIATIITLWKQNVLELLGHYGSFSINSFIVKVVQAKFNYINPFCSNAGSC